MIADTIKNLRRKNFLNQTAFAKKIGVTQGSVSQWENGLISPNSEQKSGKRSKIGCLGFRRGSYKIRKTPDFSGVSFR